MDEIIILTEADLEEVQPLGADWGEDSDFIMQWFEAGERIATEPQDWVYWLDLYEERPNRSDLFVHWLRCLFDPELPRPVLPRRIEAEPPPAIRRPVEQLAY